MNINDIQTQFQQYIGDTVDTGILLVWINEAQRDIALKYGKTVKTTLIVDDTLEVALPNDFMAIKSVSQAGVALYPDVFSINSRGVFVAAVAGSYDIEYVKLPDTIATGNGLLEPEVHSMFHDLIAMFAASRYFDGEAQGDGEEMGQAQSWMAYYRSGLQQRGGIYSSSFKKLTGWQVMI